jgi:hypothetical protein
MAETAAAKLVPVRLAQRYPNGSMVSYSGRAIAHDDISVCVLIKEEFEAGTRLSIMAPFLAGLTSARVFSVTRSTAQPGYYEIFLQIGEGADSSARWSVSGLKQAYARGASRAAAGAATPANDAQQTKQGAGVPEAVAAAAALLAAELHRLPARRLSQILPELPPDSRPAALLAAVAAALHLLERKGHVASRRLLGSLSSQAAAGGQEDRK